MIFGLFGHKKRGISGETDAEGKGSKVYLPFQTDLHSHLIPGIDDGSPSMERSLELIEGLADMGYRKIITTPHVMADTYRNSTATILEGVEKLRQELRSRGVEVQLEAAAEYYMDEELARRLREKDILRVGNEYLLFETSYYAEPLNLEETVYEIAASGYRPMLAHPERYRYVKEYEKYYGRLRELGCTFQVNINSLGGYYGIEAQQKAHWLMEKGWIDFLGSDLHTPKQLKFLRETIESGILRKVVQKNEILNKRLI